VSLLERARDKRDERNKERNKVDEAWERRNRAETARRAAFLLEGEVDPESLSKVAGDRESCLWKFDLEGQTFLAGTYWERIPGPAGYALALLVKTGHRLPGSYKWPPPAVHGGDWTLSGYTRVRSLADLADALEVAP
jgi:hypothetical protein